MLRVYMYHDVPRLFSATDNDNNIWMVLWVDEHDFDNATPEKGYSGRDDWLAVKVSAERFAKIEAGEIDLHDGFRKAESGTGYYIESPWPDGQDTAKPVFLSYLESDTFHEPGVKLGFHRELEKE